MKHIAVLPLLVIAASWRGGCGEKKRERTKQTREQKERKTKQKQITTPSTCNEEETLQLDVSNF